MGYGQNEIPSAEENAIIREMLGEDVEILRGVGGDRGECQLAIEHELVGFICFRNNMIRIRAVFGNFSRRFDLYSDNVIDDMRNYIDSIRSHLIYTRREEDIFLEDE